ncbi:hypothetical protein BsWGS_09383 [Bradybaena similaris]
MFALYSTQYSHMFTWRGSSVMQKNTSINFEAANITIELVPNGASVGRMSASSSSNIFRCHLVSSKVISGQLPFRSPYSLSCTATGVRLVSFVTMCITHNRK